MEHCDKLRFYLVPLYLCVYMCMCASESVSVHISAYSEFIKQCLDFDFNKPTKLYTYEGH